ncbi:hypothetical protein L195_g022054, partial [Trifolium pratense]
AYLNVESAQAIDQSHGSCVHKILSRIHTFHMEYDPHSNLGKLPQCFVREFGSLIDTNVILQDPNRNEFQVHVGFTYVNLKLLIISLTTRWDTDVKYPFHDPSHKHMLATPDTNSKIGTSTNRRTSSNGLVLPRSFVRTYLKKLTSYDVQSGILVLPWYDFGEFAFAFTFNELVLVDHTGCRYPCRMQFSVDSEGELACKVFGRRMDFCKKHGLAEGHRIRFAVNEPTRNFVISQDGGAHGDDAGDRNPSKDMNHRYDKLDPEVRPYAMMTRTAYMEYNPMKVGMFSVDH